LAKGQKRSNRERKKPKTADKKKPASAPPSFVAPPRKAPPGR